MNGVKLESLPQRKAQVDVDPLGCFFLNRSIMRGEHGFCKSFPYS